MLAAAGNKQKLARKPDNVKIIPTVILLISVALSAHADNWAPWEVPVAKQQRIAASSGPLTLAVRFFQKFISPVDGPRCPMYPTCSAYSLQALHKHGPFLGTLLTVDRLYREGDPHEHGQPLNKWGRIRFYDPLKQNTFWLSSQE